MGGKAALPRLRRCCTPLPIALFLSLLSAFGQAPPSCAWITQPTASGLLGGEAAGVFTTATAGQPAMCTFTQAARGVAHTMRITVETVTNAHAKVAELAKACGPEAVPLRAIGNEATVCSDREDGGPGERVIGRVRDQVFTITLTSTQTGDPLFKHDLLRARISSAAEQVSGNLF